MNWDFFLLFLKIFFTLMEVQFVTSTQWMFEVDCFQKIILMHKYLVDLIFLNYKWINTVSSYNRG